jgi:hypothetical protein
VGHALSNSKIMGLSVKGKSFGKPFSYSMYYQFSHSRCICSSFGLQGRNSQLLRLSYPQILLILCGMTKFKRLLCFFSIPKPCQSIWTLTLFLMSKRVHSMFLPPFSKSMLIQNIPLRFLECVILQNR